MIDLRSDTVTRPTPAMREAMASAPVGDDVYDEDPSIHALEERAAEMLGHEAGLYCPTGSMTNVLGVWLHVAPGTEVLCDVQAHIARAEMGAHGALTGVTMRTWPSRSGRLQAAEVAKNARVAEAERLGFDSMWTAEAYGSDVLTPLAWWGARTERMRLGTAIVQMSARTPTATAMASAMPHIRKCWPSAVPNIPGLAASQARASQTTITPAPAARPGSAACPSRSRAAPPGRRPPGSSRGSAGQCRRR